MGHLYTMTLTPAPPPPFHKRAKADKAISFRPDVEAEKALRAYCRQHGVKPAEAVEHFLRYGLGLSVAK